MADSRIKGRVRGLLGGSGPDEMPPVEQLPPVDFTPGLPDPDAQRKALQVLTLAQRTADEHVASAQQQADNIRAGARAAADQIARDAQAYAENARQEAAKAVTDARAMAEQIARDAQAHAEGVRREADEVVAAARTKATEIGKEAQARAAGLDREAQQRYDDIVGTLETKRDALHERIDELEQFDREYRTRLRTFMRGQLDLLGDEAPAASTPSQRPGGAPPAAASRAPKSE
jgi:cell division septum initiation protein DivIVA